MSRYRTLLAVALALGLASGGVRSAHAQGWEEVAPILIEAAKRIYEANSPTVQKLRAIDNELGVINAKLDRVTDLIVKLPDIETKIIKDHTIEVTQASIRDRYNTARGLMDQYPANEGPDRAAFRVSLLGLAGETNKDVSYLLDAGPASYPSASFGILLSTSMYKAIGQRPLIKDTIAREIGQFEYATKIDPKSSVVAVRQRAVDLAAGQMRELTNLPRFGRTGCGSIQIGHGENASSKRIYFYDDIIPDGIPSQGASYTFKDNGRESNNWLIGTDKWQRECDGQAHGWDAVNAYNSRLDSLRNAQNAIVLLDKMLQDIDAVTAAMLKAADLTQAQIEIVMKPPSALSVVSHRIARPG